MIGYCLKGKEHSQKEMIAATPYTENTDMSKVSVPEGVTPEIGGMIVVPDVKKFDQREYYTKEDFEDKWEVAEVYSWN